MEKQKWNQKWYYTSINWWPEEEIVDNPVLANGIRADRVTMSGRGVSGKIIATNKRIIFTPLRIQPFHRKKGVSFNLENIEAISVKEEPINSFSTQIIKIVSKAIRGTNVLPSVPYLRIELSDRFESFTVTRPELVAKSLSMVHEENTDSHQTQYEVSDAS